MRSVPGLATLVRIASGSTYQRPDDVPATVRRRTATAAAGVLALVVAALALMLLGGPRAGGQPAPPPPPNATLLLAGAGDGHGVGLSQDGALGYAQHGFAYQAILAHYYTGTTLQTVAPNTAVRVMLGTARTLTLTGAIQVNARHLSPHARYTVTVAGGSLWLHTPGHSGLRAARLTVKGSATTVSGLAAARAYRGALVLAPAGGAVQVINQVGVDAYTRGVIGAEVSASWPPAALQAQAVASRTYALTSHVGSGASAFNVYPDTRSQVYEGVAAESAATDAAVAATRGQVVAYAGKPVTTYFFASSGGHTEDIQYGFPGAAPEPWLRGVPDPYDGGPLHRWTESFTFAQAGGKLSGLVKGTFEGIEVLTRGASPRIVSAAVLGSAGNTPVSGPQLAGAFGLPSTWVYFSVRSGTRTTPEPDLSGRRAPTTTTTTTTAPPTPQANGGVGAP
jgi:stage II sporulation protein D